MNMLSLLLTEGHTPKAGSGAVPGVTGAEGEGGTAFLEILRSGEAPTPGSEPVPAFAQANAGDPIASPQSDTRGVPTELRFVALGGFVPRIEGLPGPQSETAVGSSPSMDGAPGDGRNLTGISAVLPAPDAVVPGRQAGPVAGDLEGLAPPPTTSGTPSLPAVREAGDALPKPVAAEPSRGAETGRREVSAGGRLLSEAGETPAPSPASLSGPARGDSRPQGAPAETPRAFVLPETGAARPTVVETGGRSDRPAPEASTPPSAAVPDAAPGSGADPRRQKPASTDAPSPLPGRGWSAGATALEARQNAAPEATVATRPPLGEPGKAPELSPPPARPATEWTAAAAPRAPVEPRAVQAAPAETVAPFPAEPTVGVGGAEEAPVSRSSEPSATTRQPAPPAPGQVDSGPQAAAADSDPRTTRRDRAAAREGDPATEASGSQTAQTQRSVVAASASVTVASTMLANPQSAPRDSRAEAAIAELAGPDGADPFTGDFRATEANGRGASAQPVQPAPELPRPALMQIAEAMRGGQSTIDVQLSPEELGRVRLSLGTQDGVLSVIVQADRPETADLIRRSLDLLLAEARTAGFEDVSFSFGGSGTGSGAREEHAGSAPRTPAAPVARLEPLDLAPPRMRSAEAGLDLRL